MEFIGVDGLLGGGLGVEAVAQGKLDASFLLSDRWWGGY